MLKTRLSSLLGIDTPIVMAPIGQTAEATLATAVCNAGGLGMLTARAAFPDDLRLQIQRIRAATKHPFGVGFISHLLGPRSKHFDVALEERVPVINLSFGDPSPWIPMVRSSGALVICQVQSFELAQRAVNAGADIVCVQGNEAGGHTGRENLIPFLVQVLNAFPHVPVMASGGISCGRSLAAVLAAGADGAMVGTAFLAATEAVNVKTATRDAVLASNGRDTVFSRATDLVIDHGMKRQGWPTGVAVRHRPNEITDAWSGREHELAALPEILLAYYQRMSASDPAVAMLLYGQGAGTIHRVKSAKEIVEDMVSAARAQLRRFGEN